MAWMGGGRPDRDGEGEAEGLKTGGNGERYLRLTWRFSCIFRFILLALHN